jgi:hypothetical protein
VRPAGECCRCKRGRVSEREAVRSVSHRVIGGRSGIKSETRRNTSTPPVPHKRIQWQRTHTSTTGTSPLRLQTVCIWKVAMSDATSRSPTLSPSPSPLLDARLRALHPSTHPHVFALIGAHADRPTLVSLARTSQEVHLLLAPQLYHTVDFR